MLARLAVLVLAGLVAACGADPGASTGARVPEAEGAHGEAGSRARGGGPAVTGALGGTTCEAARATWADAAAGKGVDYPEPPAEHDEALKRLLNDGAYIGACNVPATAAVSVCAAIVEGEARGVTVTIEGGQKEQADCVADAIGKLKFPSHATMSITKTSFAPQ